MNNSLMVYNIDPVDDEFLPEPFVDEHGRVVPFVDDSVLVKVPLTKHMSGQHDQSSHGNWAGGGFKSAGMDGSYQVYDHPSGSKIYFQTSPTLADSLTQDMKMRREEAIGYVNDLLTKYPLHDVTFVFGNGVDEKYKAAGVTLPYLGKQGEGSWGFPLSSTEPNMPSTIDSWIGYNVPNISRDKIKGALVVFQPYHFARRGSGSPKTYGEIATDHYGVFDNKDSHAGWDENGLKTIITHEYGHLLDQRTYEQANSDFGSFPMEATSNYGRKNNRELFAESFTAWELEPNNSKYQNGLQFFKFDSTNTLSKSVSGFHVEESYDPNVPPVVVEFGGFAKHLQGQHDQSTHGSWAHAVEGKNHTYTFVNSELHTKIVLKSHSAWKYTDEEIKKITDTVDDLSKKIPLAPFTNLVIDIAENDFENEHEMAYCSEYALTPEKHEFIDGRTQQTAPVTQNLHIAIRPSLVKKATKVKKEWFMPSYTQDKQLEYLIAHEYGHALTLNKYRHLIPHLLGKSSDYSQSKFEEMYQEMDKDTSGFSDYSKQNVNERYAEVFAEWYISDGHSPLPHVNDFAKHEGWTK